MKLSILKCLISFHPVEVIIAKKNKRRAGKLMYMIPNTCILAKHPRSYEGKFDCITNASLK